MTPAERARQIDMEEFAAESAAVRERALAYAKDCREREAKGLEAWMRSESATVRQRGMKAKNQRIGTEKGGRTNAQNAKLYSAFGHKRTMNEWAEETGIARATITSRLAKGWTIEDALTVTVRARTLEGLPCCS